MRATAFFKYATERYKIYLAKEQGEAREIWTTDNILSQYRFCNVFRDDDKVTKWWIDNVQNPIIWNSIGNSEDVVQKRLLLSSIVFRWLNRISTGEAIKQLLVGGDYVAIEHALRKIVAAKEPILGAAYMIKTPLGKDKTTGLMECFAPFIDVPASKYNELFQAHSLERLHKWLMQFPWMGHFMAYEVVCDMIYNHYFSAAPDRYTWANAGPGAIRGLNRVFRSEQLESGELLLDSTKFANNMLSEMQQLLALSSGSSYWNSDWPRWDMRTVEHTLCEFDKYERARLGQGKPKQRYR